MRATVADRIEVSAPGELVWDYVTDWPRQSEWVPLTQVRTVRGNGHELGGGMEARTGVGPVGFLDKLTITHWDPPHRCEVLHTGRLVRGEAGFVVVPLGSARCRFEWWEQLVVPGGPLGVLGWWLGSPLARAGLHLALTRMRRQVEGLPE